MKKYETAHHLTNRRSLPTQEAARAICGLWENLLWVARAICGLWKNFQIAQEKSYDYVIMIHMKKYEIAPLTNREALTVHCSVVKHAGSGYSTKEV